MFFVANNNLDRFFSITKVNEFKNINFRYKGLVVSSLRPACTFNPDTLEVISTLFCSQSYRDLTTSTNVWCGDMTVHLSTVLREYFLYYFTGKQTYRIPLANFHLLPVGHEIDNVMRNGLSGCTEESLGVTDADKHYFFTERMLRGSGYIAKPAYLRKDGKWELHAITVVGFSTHNLYDTK
jgi:hypothetical protein